MFTTQSLILKDFVSLVYGDYSYCDSQILEQNSERHKAGAGISVGTTYQE